MHHVEEHRLFIFKKENNLLYFVLTDKKKIIDMTIIIPTQKNKRMYEAKKDPHLSILCCNCKVPALVLTGPIFLVPELHTNK